MNWFRGQRPSCFRGGLVIVWSTQKFLGFKALFPREFPDSNQQRLSRHEGDLITKCYYAKRNIVWEILDVALKSKIEIQWSDIEGMRATICDDETGILELELNEPPQFFRETNLQPRKHTVWQHSSDFTGGQASIYRRHYVKFPLGILEKHDKKLLQKDKHLLEISRKLFP
ncbi:uncharacterized protein LOC130785806 [Actinidia eriantha]|uniref:uncharacterized protein LOC130785806 n=1 Tax=Actinidia eriantha TaxID=165200 RepID=UPI0025877332|nr:uncharacterized protein LOC130785806 [Actinidia eriantha]XP_057501987.1 uncharacterized protein LOC130785806 [Actinidia eriantha]